MLNEQIGQYRITEKLGQGGMGEIFAAYDQTLNRTVAVKVIASSRLGSDQSRRLFLREARAAAALDHPFICAIHNVLEYEGQPLIVMEMVQGETLQDRIARGALPVSTLCQFAIEIAEALAAAHARGIVHRDIKSSNIMITASGHVKVMDFGLAQMVGAMPEDETAHVSEERRVAGTLPYIAPEVLRGEEASPLSDLYALGVVLYEMATGRRPFAAKTDAMLSSDILNVSRRHRGRSFPHFRERSTASPCACWQKTHAAGRHRLTKSSKSSGISQKRDSSGVSARWPCCRSAP